MTSRVKKLISWFKTWKGIAVLLFLVIVMSVSGYLVYAYFQYKSWEKEPYRYIPASSTSVIYVQDPQKKFNTYFGSPWGQFIMWAGSGSGNGGKDQTDSTEPRGTGNGTSASSISERLQHLKSVVLCRSTGRGGGYLVAGYMKFPGYLASGWVLERMVSTMTGNPVSQISVREVPVYQSRRSGRPFFLAARGPILLFSDQKSLLAEALSERTEEKEVHPAEDRFEKNRQAETPSGVQAWTNSLPLLEKTPVREMTHWIRPEGLGHLYLGSSIEGLSLKLFLEGTLTDDAVDEPARTSFVAEETPDWSELADMIPSDSTLSVLFSSYPVKPGWKKLQTYRKGRVESFSPAIRDEASMIFNELGYYMDSLQQKGVKDELLDQLGAPSGFVLTREKLDSEEPIFGTAGFVRVTGSGDRVISLLDRVFLNSEDRLNKLMGVKKQNIRGFPVRILNLAYEKWGKGLTPCYTVVNQYVILSSSIRLIEQVIQTYTGLQNSLVDRTSFYDKFSEMGQSQGIRIFQWMDVNKLAGQIKNMSSSIATHRVNNLNDRKLRKEVKAEVESKLSKQGKRLSGEQLENRVTRAFYERKREMKEEVKHEVLNLARQLIQFKDISWALRMNSLENARYEVHSTASPKRRRKP